MGEDEFGPWTKGIQEIERRWSRLLLNPEANLIFAYHALLHQVENDIEELDVAKKDDFVNSVSYQLAKNLVCYQLRTREKVEEPFKYQFKVGALMQGSDDKEMTDFLVSAVHETKE